MKLTPKQKQLVKEYAKSLQSKKLNEGTNPKFTQFLFLAFKEFIERGGLNDIIGDYLPGGLSIIDYSLNNSGKKIIVYMAKRDDEDDFIKGTKSKHEISFM